MTRTTLDIPLGGWVESIVGIPEELACIIQYKNELINVQL
jgi:hypothetical protein